MTIDDLVGAATPLAEADVRAAAAQLGVGPAKLRAVLQVESRGRGFHPTTRRPIILFEPHVFSKRTGGRFDQVRPDLSYPTWGTLPYPPSQTERYQQLAGAMQLALAAALESASWGLFQLMGYQARLCGFADAPAFARAMATTEAAQLAAFVSFLQANPGMVEALKLSDWAGFARLYNGPGYAQHGYDQRLKAAFAQLVAAPPGAAA